MRMGLIGHTAHFYNYRKVLDEVEDLEIVAVAKAADIETLERFDKAPGVTEKTKRYQDPQGMLDKEKLDVVQVATAPHLVPRWTKACLERNIPVMSEKPIAMNLEELDELHRLCMKNGVPLCAMHGQREAPWLQALHHAVTTGRIGEPVLMRSQKSYKWRGSRPDYYKSRETFPGIIPYVGIHALDWKIWILGDVFTEVCAYQSTALRPDYAGCESHAACLLKMRKGGMATLTMDYLGPEARPTHGDEQVRVVGPEGIVEGLAIPGTTTLTTKETAPTKLEAPEYPHWYVSFIRSLQGEGEALITTTQVFRITEIALKARQSADEGKPVSLENSPYELR